MKDERKNVREPFDPERTPNPPQTIHPTDKDEKASKDQPAENNKAESDRKPAEGPESKPKEKLLGESEIEIDDETTI